MSNSFYGGRDGRPFIINHRYKTIEAMLTSISSDSDFSTFPVGEYCIINTDDLNHPDNGKIFRRNFPNKKLINQNKKNNDGGYIIESIDAKGMQLIGQIVGPAGPAAKILLEDYDAVEAKKTDAKLEGQYDKYETEGDLTLTKGDILDPSLNNKIYWTSCALRDKDNKDSTCYVGFKIPYTKINITSESVSPYYTEPLTVWRDFSKLGEEINVFSQNWHINIPKGIHGQNIQDFALDKNTGLMTYVIRNYDNKESGEDTSYTLNESYPLTWITSVTLDPETGKLDIDTNNQKNDLDANLTWVKNLTVGETGLLNTITTTGKNQIKDQQLHWIKSIETAADGTVNYIEVDGKSKTSQPQLINWITDISFDNAGNIAIETNNNNIENIQKQITWISKVERPENTQVLAIDFNNSAAGNQHIEANLRTPNSIYTTEEGLFKADYNTGETETLGRMFYQGAEEPTDLTIGGLWIETVEVGE